MLEIRTTLDSTGRLSSLDVSGALNMLLVSTDG